MFITIDGGDGCGKSTQRGRLERFLADRGTPVFVCRDPGSTPLGESIRGILLNRKEWSISSTSEMFLFMAARAQMVTDLIRPALDAGQVVVCDRFLLSTIVYQGYAGGLDLDAIRRVGEIATGGLVPDLTVVLDIDPAVAQKRLTRPFDRMESKGTEYHRRVRDGFLAEAKIQVAAGRSVLVLDAVRSPDDLAADIAAAVEKQMKLK